MILIRPTNPNENAKIIHILHAMIDPFVLAFSNCDKSKGAVVLEVWVGEAVVNKVGSGVGESLGGNDGGTEHCIPP